MSSPISKVSEVFIPLFSVAAVMECLVFFGGMISQLTSGLWIENLGFVAPYWFIFVCLLSSVLYIIVFVPESRASSSTVDKKLIMCKLFSLSSIKRVWYVYKYPRNGARRNLVIFTLCCGVTVLTTLGVSGVVVLFLLHSPLCFSAEKVGYFSAFRYFSQGLGAVLGIKLLGRCVNEVNIARAGIISVALSLLMLGFSKVEWLVFTGKYRPVTFKQLYFSGSHFLLVSFLILCYNQHPWLEYLLEQSPLLFAA